MRKFALVAAICSIFTLSNAYAAEQCDSAGQSLEGAKGARAGISTEIKGMEAEIVELRKKMASLKTGLEAKKEEMIKANRAVHNAQRERNIACAPVEDCKKNKIKLENLKKRIAPLKERLNEIQGELETKKAKADEYKTTVDGIQAKYKELKCRQIKADTADQASVDTCYAEYDKLEAMKKEMTTLTMEIRKQGRAHERLMERLSKIREELTFVGHRIRKSCDGGPEVKELQAVEKEQQEFEPVGAAIQKVDQDHIKVRKTSIKKPLVGRKVKKQA